MGADADWMLESAVRSMVEGDIELAGRVIRFDDELDRQDVDIEAECLRILALQQPVARDLRLVGSTIKAITDIERIGDYAVDIAKIGRRIARVSFYKPLIDVPRLLVLVRQMLKDVLKAFVDHDLALVAEVVSDDDAVDKLFHEQRDYLIERIQQDNTDAFQMVYILFAAKYLERAADHVVNIAKRVNFIQSGSLSQLVESHKSASQNGGQPLRSHL
jgi:phosphate transport system protein